MVSRGDQESLLSPSITGSSIELDLGPAAESSEIQSNPRADAIFWNELRTTRDQISNLEKRVEAIKADTQKVAAQTGRRVTQDSLQALAVFVGLFTFVSLEFQIAELAPSIFGAAGITLIFLGGYGLFLLALNAMLVRPPMLRARQKVLWQARLVDFISSRRMGLVVLSMLALGGGLALTLIGGNGKSFEQAERDLIRQEIEYQTKDFSDLRREIEDLKLDNALLRQCLEVDIKICKPQ